MKNKYIPPILSKNALELSASFLCFLGYLSISYPYPDWLDSPELAARAQALGLFHPPGSPLAILAANIFSQMPIFWGNYSLIIFSPFFAACSVFVFIKTTHRLFSYFLESQQQSIMLRIWISLLGLFFGFSSGMLQQAQRLEVYTLGLWICLLIIYHLLSVLLTKQDSRKLQHVLRAVFYLGAGVSIHPLMALSSFFGIIPILILESKLLITARNILKAFFIGSIGCFTLFLIPLMIHGQQDMHWGAIASVTDYFRYVSGAAFASSYAASGAGVTGSILNSGIILLNGVGYASVGLCIVALIYCLRCAPRIASVLILVLLANFSTIGLQKNILISNPDALGYILPSSAALYSLIAFFAALIYHQIFHKLIELPGKSFRKRLHLYLALTGIICLGIAVISIANIKRHNAHTCFNGLDLARKQMDVLPKNAVVILKDFNFLFMLEYLQIAEGRNTDVALLYYLDLARLNHSDFAEKPVSHGKPQTLSEIYLTLGEQKEYNNRPLYFDSNETVIRDASIKPSDISPWNFLWLYSPGSFQQPGDFDISIFNGICPETDKEDVRTNLVLSWHGYFSAELALKSGHRSLAQKYLNLAHCAAPDDVYIKSRLGALNLPMPSCPKIGPSMNTVGQDPRIPFSSRAIWLALGLILWFFSGSRIFISRKYIGLSGLGMLLTVLIILF